MRGLDHLLGNLGFRRAEHTPNSTMTPTSPSSPPAHDQQIASYPSVDPGIPALAIDEVLGPHQDLIERIRICYGVDRAAFERELLTLIRRYAAFVHLLPATPDNYFNTPGGLLRMGLEVAFFSLQGTDGHIFSGRASITTRRHLEPRWRRATFIAGLCCEIHRTLCHVIVTDERGDEWQPYLTPLSNWLTGQQAARFYLKWRPNVHETRALGIFTLPHVVPGETLQHLAFGNAIVIPHMMASISGMPIYQERNILDDLVRRSVALVIDRYLQASADRYGKPQLGSHLERYLVDALRRLVTANSAWIPNAEKSRVWYGSDGLFIVWPNAATEIRALLEADQLPGIPKAPETMLEILVAAGVFDPKEEDQATWQILPPGAKIAIEAVKLSSPAILFSGVDQPFHPLSIALLRSTENESATTAATAPATPSPTSDHGDQPSQTTSQLSLPIEHGPTSPGPTAVDARQDHAEPRAASTPRVPVANPTAGSVPTTGVNRELFPVSIKLNAPMRLNPAVRRALAHIIDTLNHDPADAAAHMSASGLFIPLEEFERRHIEPSLALRALAEVKMLATQEGADDTQTHTGMRDVGGQQTLGLLLHPRFIAGFDPGDVDRSIGAGN